MATYQKRGNNWRVIVRKQGFPVQSRTFRTKGMAQEWARKTEDDMASGKMDADARLQSLTLGEIWKSHVEHLKHQSHRRDYRNLTDAKIMNEYFGSEMPIGDLDYNALVKFCEHRVKNDGVSPATNQRTLMALSSALSTATMTLDLPSSYVLEMKKWRKQVTRSGLSGKPQSRERRASQEELDSIIAAAYHTRHMLSSPLHDVVEFAVESAMRQGEILSIRWEDLDAAAGIIVIRDRKHPTMKSGNHQRVPLMGKSLEIIQRQPREDARIFPYTKTQIGGGFTRICERLKIKDLRFHDLRHEGISRLFEQGYQIQEVSMVSGHRDWGSLKRYTNLRPEDLVVREREQLAKKNRPPAEVEEVEEGEE